MIIVLYFNFLESFSFFKCVTPQGRFEWRRNRYSSKTDDGLLNTYPINKAFYLEFESIVKSEQLENICEEEEIEEVGLVQESERVSLLEQIKTLHIECNQREACMRGLIQEEDRLQAIRKEYLARKEKLEEELQKARQGPEILKFARSSLDRQKYLLKKIQISRPDDSIDLGEMATACKRVAGMVPNFIFETMQQTFELAVGEPLEAEIKLTALLSTASNTEALLNTARQSIQKYHDQCNIAVQHASDFRSRLQRALIDAQAVRPHVTDADRQIFLQVPICFILVTRVITRTRCRIAKN